MEPEIEKLRQRRLELQVKLNNPEITRDPLKLKDISVGFAKIDKKLKDLERLESVRQRIRENEKIILGEDDEDLKAVAREETDSLKKTAEEIERKLNGAEDLPNNLIMEIRAGAGGTEASLFAKKLFEMYSHFADKKNWKTSLLEESKSELGGYKEVVFEIAGEDAFKTLRYESGVHRVQRIPETEKSGRIHTSTASVAVLPKAREVDVEIKPQDIKIEFFRSSGPGGQNVNKVETAVRIYHLPSGITVTSQESRSQQKNRERAMELLRAKLLDIKILSEGKKIADERRQQIGTQDRSEKIRTYNFPQDRVTDHRIQKSWHNIESLMAGGIEPIVEEFQKL